MDTTLPHPQAELDAEGVYEFPRATVQPEVPVFVDSDQHLSARPGSVIDTYQCGTAVAIGWPRGLVSDDHWTPEGWRTRGDAYLTARGTGWDSGIQYPQPTRWSTVKVLKVAFRGKKFVPSWNGVPIAGSNSDELGYDDSPDPWQLVVRDGRAWFNLRTNDGVVRKWTTQIDPTDNSLDVSFEVDLTTGAATATLKGAPNPVDSAQAGTGFGPTTRLRDNQEAPFCVFHLVPHQHGRGYIWAPHQTIPDVSVARLTLTADGTPLCDLHGDAARPETYPGGPGLPLVKAAGDGRFLWVVHTSQWEPHGAQWSSVRGLTIHCRPGNPAVQMGGVFGAGGVLLDGLRVVGGTRGVQAHGFLKYPFKVKDCLFQHQGEYGLWLFRGCGMTLENVQCDYYRRAAVHLRECWGEVRGSVLYAPAYAGETSVMEQYGGQVNYQGHTADYEDPNVPRPPFLTLTPASQEGFDTIARLTSCSTLGGLAADVHPRARNYDGDVRVEVNADNPWDNRVRAAAGVYPTLVGCVRED